jgi:hypothetical protein
MALFTTKNFVNAYLLAVFLLAILFSPPPQLYIALILFVLQLYTVYKPLRTSLTLPLTIGTLVFTPLILEPLAGNLSPLVIIPALYLLDQNLKENKTTHVFSPQKTGKKATSTLTALTTTLIVLSAASFLLWNQTLAATTAILMVYITAILSYITIKVPKAPLTEAKTFSRSLVGDTQNQLATLHGKAGVPLTVLLNPQEPWVQVEPTNFELHKNGKANIRLRFTPPLAGPSTLQIQATTRDPWGLTKTNQKLQPVELHIIPKAKYAQWLAKKFLEQTASGISLTTVVFPDKVLRAAKRGGEYQGSRMFQAGDKLRDVDWKHSVRLNELVSKEFADFQGQPAIIAANLTVKDAEEADVLVSNFVMTALTLANESLTTALAVYNYKEVFAVSRHVNPREALKKTLKLSEKITHMEPAERFLQSTEAWRLKRTMSQLGQADVEASQRLLGMLQLEYQAHQQETANNPAIRALSKVTEHIPPPAIITVVPSSGQDAEGLAMVLEKLEKKGYTAVTV